MAAGQIAAGARVAVALMLDYSVTFYEGFDSASTSINANYDTDADNKGDAET